MRVLFLYPYLPAPDAGHGSARLVSRLLADLRGRAEISLVCAYRPGERDLVDSVRPLCDHLYAVERPFASDMGRPRRATESATTGLRLIASRLPIPVVKLRRSGIKRAVRDAVRERRPEIAHVELATMAQYVELLPPSLPAVLVDHEAGGPAGEEVRRWQAYVKDVYTRFARVVTLSEDDRDELHRLEGSLAIDVRPPGIAMPAAVERAPEPGRVLFFGSPEHGPNRDALQWIATDVAPRLRKLRPDSRIVCAGALPDDELVALCARAGVELLGFVGDLGAELSRAAVVLSPVRSGRGVRIKNIQTLAHAVPLVTSPLGARGLGLASGTHAIVASGARTLTKATVELLDHPDRAEAMAGAGRDHVLARHAPELQADRTIALWRSLVSEL